jgi:hypothetical protein
VKSLVETDKKIDDKGKGNAHKLFVLHPLVEVPVERGEIVTSPKSLWNFLLFLLARNVFDELPHQVFLCNQISTSLDFYSPVDATCCMLGVTRKFTDESMLFRFSLG